MRTLFVLILAFLFIASTLYAIHDDPPEPPSVVHVVDPRDDVERSAPTTTTTVAPTTTAPTTTVPPRARTAPTERTVRVQATGIDWDALQRCECPPGWHCNTGNGYFGGLQFSLSSWRSVGGTGYPHEHSRETQIAMAERLSNGGRNMRHWPTCARKLGYL